MPHHQIMWMTLLALTLLRHQKSGKALALLKALVLLRPDQPELILWLAEAHLAETHGAEAIALVKRLESSDAAKPILAAAALIRAQAHWQLDHQVEAAAALKDFLKVRKELIHG